MHIHIVCRNWTGMRIIPRLAAVLQEMTGWSIGPKFKAEADANYFFPYIELAELRHRPKSSTIAAWFTHRDTYQKGKAKQWDKAADWCDMRITSAKQYYDILVPYGPTSMAMVPLDRSQFNVNPIYRKGNRSIIGVAGYVYPGGRKGEGLVRELNNSAMVKSKRIELVASGKGWVSLYNVETPFSQLPGYYRGLDIYLCSSLCEGLPFGPLEALACGKKIVIPEGVGMLDELPNLPGVVRYKAGNYEAMVEAIEEAVEVEADPKELREITKPFSAWAWGQTHTAALNHLIKQPPPKPTYNPSVKPVDYSNCGMYCVGYGEPARNVAITAILSFKRHHPIVPVAFVGEEPLGVEDHFICYPDKDIGGRQAKISIDLLAPSEWKYILYLDADTETVAEIGAMFGFLQDGWDFVICRNPGKYDIIRNMVRPDNHDESDFTFDILGSKEIMQLNGGVFSYVRNKKTKQFFRYWMTEWNRYGKRDQAALHRALWRQPLKTYILGNEWNTIDRYPALNPTAGIMHYPIRARDWTGRIDGRLDSREAWKAAGRTAQKKMPLE